MRDLLAFILLPAAACSGPVDLFLTRPGRGTTGSEQETLRYYQITEQLLRAADPALTAGSGLSDFLNNRSRCFNQGGTSVNAYYYNDSDLGLGREMRCAECGARAPVPGLISCAVSNHGTPQGLDIINIQLANPATSAAEARASSIGRSIAALEGCGSGGFTACRGATVAMDYLPDSTGLPPQRRVRFYIYDAEAPGKQTAGNRVPGALIPGLRLDSDDRLNPDGVKYIRNCMSCHGGKFIEGEIQGASFLDFDLSLLVFGDDDGVQPGDMAPHLTARGRQLDALRQMNAMVQEVVQATGAAPIADRLFNSYVNSADEGVGPIAGATYAFLPETGRAYVPDGWPDTPLGSFAGQPMTARQFYLTGVRKYCATCHFTQQAGFNLQTRQALTFFDSLQYLGNGDPAATPDRIRQDVCGSSAMPHAEVTRNHFRGDSAAVSLLCNGCNFDQAAPAAGECLR